ncbi:DUF3467 domain-containing protein [Methanocalculus taiwanensis]|uniref:DUF3467 domain-containing protein n=1 Tax=Methanocalculus taiwanensis TaxID=106207 RepID=A0ABD4TFV5_9EURY|nr:DUF3467 domain-containing protein [Methanocalculus taiwanensis]MCQ1537852.1 DUF3467 domain-containing protein [Methanocalculus taiwanensis]
MTEKKRGEELREERVKGEALKKEIRQTGDGGTTLDLSRLYTFNQEDPVIDISSSAYSNLAYVQASHRDISIDFLEMPGIRGEDGRMKIKGTRIFMSHSAAQKLASAIPEILEKLHSEGRMEAYTPQKEQEREL